MGKWYEHARDKSITYEKGECVQAKYTALPDGTIQVRNTETDVATNTINGVTFGAFCATGAQCYV